MIEGGEKNAYEDKRAELRKEEKEKEKEKEEKEEVQNIKPLPKGIMQLEYNKPDEQNYPELCHDYKVHYDTLCTRNYMVFFALFRCTLFVTVATRCGTVNTTFLLMRFFTMMRWNIA